MNLNGAGFTPRLKFGLFFLSPRISWRDKVSEAFRMFSPPKWKQRRMPKFSAGFIGLVSVLIVSAVVLVLSLGLLSRSYEETVMGFGEQESHRALGLANLCAELALIRLQSILNYAGGESIIEDGESCDILAVGGAGNLNRTIKTQSVVSQYHKKVKVEITLISPVLNIASWEEVPDF